MDAIKKIDSNTLRNWLEAGTPVSILDIRPINERAEWFIPQSIYFNAYDKLKINDKTALQGLHLDKSIPVVAMCAGGKTSLIAAELLQNQGYNAYSLDGGMKGWSLSWNTAKLNFQNFDVIQFRRTGKGCLSYIVVSGSEAIVVDASLSVEVYEQFLKENNLTLKYVTETHIHADHLSRSKQLAERNMVSLHLPIPNKVAFDFKPLEKIFHLGGVQINAINTPGHTLESTSFLIDNKILLTGDTLFIKGVGRPDLKASNEEVTQKAKMLYDSLQKLFELNSDITVLPSHTSQPVDFDNKPIQTTLKEIYETVTLVKLNESEFVSTILQRIPPTPANYLSIVEKNIEGDFSKINPIDLEAGANRCAIP